MAKSPLDIVLGDISKITSKTSSTAVGVYSGIGRSLKRSIRPTAEAYSTVLNPYAGSYLRNVMSRSSGSNAARASTQRSYTPPSRSFPKVSVSRSSGGGQPGVEAARRRGVVSGSVSSAKLAGEKAGRAKTLPKQMQSYGTPKPTSKPKSGGNGKATIGGGQVQARRAAIKDLLSKAEKAAAAGNIQAAANFSAAALNRQKAGKGSAASMKRVTKVAQAYSTAAGRKKIENQSAGRTRLGKPPVKGKKG